MKVVFKIAELINRKIEDKWDLQDNETYMLEVWDDEEFENELDAIECLYQLVQESDSLTNFTILKVYKK